MKKTTKKTGSNSKNKGGRPEIKDSEKRKYPVKTLLKAKEYKKIKHEISLLNLSESEFFRIKLLSETLPGYRKLPPKVMIELNRIGVNLNQITRKINATSSLSKAEGEKLHDTINTLTLLIGETLTQ